MQTQTQIIVREGFHKETRLAPRNHFLEAFVEMATPVDFIKTQDIS